MLDKTIILRLVSLNAIILGLESLNASLPVNPSSASEGESEYSADTSANTEKIPATPSDTSNKRPRDHNVVLESFMAEEGVPSGVNDDDNWEYTVKLIGPTRFSVPIDIKDKIQDLHDATLKQETVDVHAFVYNGMKLELNSTLYSYHIEYGETIKIVLKCAAAGGMVVLVEFLIAVEV